MGAIRSRDIFDRSCRSAPRCLMISVSARAYIHNDEILCQICFMDCTVLIFHSENRLVANKSTYTNFLHGTVPAYWCSHSNYPKKCNLGEVNLLCLPSDCPERSWCSLNHDCAVLDGHWSEWGDECSGDGIRLRTCTRRRGGKPCIGNSAKACTGTNKRFLCRCL